MTIELQSKPVKEIDASGFFFYVEEGKLFDVDGYAEAFSLDRNDIDTRSIHAVQDAAGSLAEGEFLEVTHDIS